MFVGNGGSAGIASHLAIDFSKNGGLRSLAFNDASALTCLGNDLGYENVFAKQIDFHARAGDLLIAISSSGRSAEHPRGRQGRARARLPGGDLFGFHRGQRSAPHRRHQFLRAVRANTASSRWPTWRSAMRCSTSIWAGANRPDEPAAQSANSADRHNGTEMAKRFKRVLVTGGAGYVGSNLVPKLLAAGYEVTVLDLYIYGDIFAELKSNPRLTEVKGDLRNAADVARAVAGCDAVIHLACISNDPSFDLNPELGRSINFDCFRPLVKAAKDAGVRRFIYASSSSVYGIKNDMDVTEELPLEPLTDYSKYKAMCEEVLEAGARAGLRRGHAAAGDGVRLCAAAAPRPHRQHPHQSRHQQRPHHGVRRRPAAAQHPRRGHDRPLPSAARGAGRGDRRQDLERRLSQPQGSRRSPRWCGPRSGPRSTSSSRRPTIIAPTTSRPRRFAASSASPPSARSRMRSSICKAAFVAGKVPNSMTDDRYYNIKRMQGLKLR